MGRKLKDYTGQICGCWKVIERDYFPTSISHETFWKCKCLNCGNEISVRKSDLDRKPKCCNKCKSNITSNCNHLINIGDTFGLLTILDKPHIEKGRHSYVKCQCQCGKIIKVRKDHLFRKDHPTVSCGCAIKSAGEIKLEQICQENNWDYQMEYRIKDFNILSPFDCAIFKDNELFCLIEYDGQQHFEAVDLFGGEMTFQEQQQRDIKKNEWCVKNNVVLLRIPYTDYDILNKEYLFSKIPKLRFLDSKKI